MECGMLTGEPNPVGTVPLLGKFDPFHLFPLPAHLRAGGEAEDAAAAQSGGARRREAGARHRRQWGCLSFRGRLNGLSPLPPVIGDLAAERAAGGKGTGGRPGANSRGTWAGAGPRGQLLWPASGAGGGSMWKWGRAGGGRGAAFWPRSVTNGPSSAAGARVGGFRGRDAWPTARAREPRTKPRRGAATALTPGNRLEARRRPALIPAGGRRRLFVGSTPPSSPDGFL